MGRLKNELLPKFFMGRLYPLLVGAVVVLGYCFGIELYLNIFSILAVSLALAVCSSARPAILFVISFVFQVSVKNSPGAPNFSNYYFTSWHLYAVFALGAVLLASAVYFGVKNKIFSGFSLTKTPILLSLLILSVSFMTNGLFSGKWALSGFVYGICNAACLVLVFLFFYGGLRNENAKELVSYFIYSSAILVVALITELAWCYVTNDIAFDLFTWEIDVLEKDKLDFGWGISNTMGVSLIVLIPALLLGFYEKVGRFFYVPLAGVVYVATFATMSRNAILFGTVTLVLSLAAMLIASRHKKITIPILAAAIIAAVILVTINRAEIYEKFSAYFTDNGRFRLWEHGIDNFKAHPIFGVGFFGFELTTFVTAEFLPTMAHQTFVQILSAMGIFGMAAYAFYRVCTLLPLFSRPSISKTLLALSAGAMLFESLLDNFIFYFLPTLHYSIALAILFTVHESSKKKTQNKT